jgi:hypothetical protein
MQSQPGIYYVTQTVQQGKPPVRVIAHFQRTRGRTVQGGIISLFFPDKIYQLDPSRKVYRAAQPALLKPGEDPTFRNAKVNASSRPGGKTKTILGEKVRNWVISCNTQLDLSDLAKKAPTDEERRKLPRSLTAQMEIENWNMVKEEIDPAVLRAVAVLAGYQSPMGKIMQPLLAAASKQHGLLLSTTLRIKMSTQPPQKNALNGLVTVTTNTVTLEHKTLPNSLFAIPAGYKLIPWDKW